MFEPRISAGAKEKLPFSGKLDADISSWSYDMEGHSKKCVERYCELANKTPQRTGLTTPCLDYHQFKEEELDLLENCQTYDHKWSWNVCIWHALVDLLFYCPWTNLLVLSQNKDDSGSYAVFTEQGSSASQMTAAKVMDIRSRLPGCDGQAADSVSA